MNKRARAILILYFVSFLLMSFPETTFHVPEVRARAHADFGNKELPKIPTINWTQFWNKFNAHSFWDLEYNNGSGWNTIKSDLEIIKNYTVRNDSKWIVVNKTEASACKITLNFTASQTADYRLTFAIDLIVKNYTHRENSWNYTITYGNYTTFFDWSDVKQIPNLMITHGVKDGFFWFRIRKDNVPIGKNVIIDPIFGHDEIEYGYYNPENIVTGSIFTCPGYGIAQNITVLLITTGSWTGKIKAGIYLHSDLSLVGSTEERTITLSTTALWYTFNFSAPKPILLTDTDYILVGWAEAVYGICAMLSGVGETNQGHQDIEVYNGFPDPLIPWHSNREFSIYCFYSAELDEEQGSPSSDSGAWNNPTGAYADGTDYAYVDTASSPPIHQFSDYGFDFNDSVLFVSVIIRYDAWTEEDEMIRVRVNWNNGALDSWSARQETVLNQSETTYYYDVTFATEWTPEKLSDGYLLVEVDCIKQGGGENKEVDLDWIPITVQYQVPFAPGIYSVTFYFHAGGTLLVDGISTANGTSNDYEENTIVNITGIPTRALSQRFGYHIYDSSETTNNPFYLTVTQNYITHTYFLRSGEYFTIGLMGAFIFFPLLIIVIWASRRH